MRITILPTPSLAGILLAAAKTMGVGRRHGIRFIDEVGHPCPHPRRELSNEERHYLRPGTSDRRRFTLSRRPTPVPAVRFIKWHEGYYIARGPKEDLTIVYTKSGWEVSDHCENPQVEVHPYLSDAKARAQEILT